MQHVCSMSIASVEDDDDESAPLEVACFSAGDEEEPELGAALPAEHACSQWLAWRVR